MALLRARTGAATAWKSLALLVAVVSAGRVLLAASLGLGVDEAYTVATARTLALSTFDHPPLAWWLTHGAATYFASESPLAVRAPFIVIGALTLVAAFDLGRTLYTPRVGLAAAAIIALSPVLGWTSGSMVLPDGPLLASLLATGAFAGRAAFGDPARAPWWWIATGMAAGVACLSKLHGFALFPAVGLFILTVPNQRHWLTSPWPYLAGLIALVIFSPVIIWNAEHHWASFAFQTGRAELRKLSPSGPVVALAGQALFLAPWVWVVLAISLVRGAWHGPGRARDWLLFCLALGPIAVFTLAPLGGTKTLFHWAAPGYLFATVLSGRDIVGEIDRGLRRPKVWLYGSGVAIAVLLLSVIALAWSPWQTENDPRIGLRPVLDLTWAGLGVVPQPLFETLSWRDLGPALAARGLLGADTLVAGTKWNETGRIAVALGPAVAVRCICDDARGFGVLYGAENIEGRDVLVVSTAPLIGADGRATVSTRFQHRRAEALEPVTILHMGRPVETLHITRLEGVSRVR